MSFRFFQNTKCEYFPCHKNTESLDIEDFKPDAFNCLFCYCPLYHLGNKCGGNFVILKSGVKDCSMCITPHKKSNYDYILSKLKDSYSNQNETKVS